VYNFGADVLDDVDDEDGIVVAAIVDSGAADLVLSETIPEASVVGTVTFSVAVLVFDAAYGAGVELFSVETL
jgi:hypothetical protein